MRLPSIGATSDVPEAFPSGPTSPNADRDTALDHDPAAVGPARPAEPTGPTPSQEQAAEDVDAAITKANQDVNLAHVIDFSDPPAPVGPLARFRELG